MDKILEPTPIQKSFSSLCPELVLASSSPNRKKLLMAGGSIVHTFSPDADESIEGMEIEEAMMKNARVKMMAYLSSPSFRPSLIAISADTLVNIDGRMIGKPESREEAGRILSLLSGKRQTVLTGTALYVPEKGMTVFCDKGDVIFKRLTEKDIESYLDTGEWKGAAGAYRLQENGYRLVDRIEGDWTTVVGLPLERITALLS